MSCVHQGPLGPDDEMPVAWLSIREEGGCRKPLVMQASLNARGYNTLSVATLDIFACMQTNLLMLNDKIFNLVFSTLREICVGTSGIRKVCIRSSRDGISMRKKYGVF